MSEAMPEDGLHRVRDWLIGWQQQVCDAVEAWDGTACFGSDRWKRAAGGGGESRVIKAGALMEQGGVNFSHVMGDALPDTATEQRPELAGKPFQAMGVSLVLHPWNPYVPTTHANLRLFVAGEPGGGAHWWFGGGLDLTPCYPFDEDCRAWHQTARAACEPFGEDVYPCFKRWCDQYFRLPHRDEQRGIGGLFFDDLNHWGFERTFAFIRGVGSAFLEGYAPIVDRRRECRYGERERAFQLYRRGRYVEFNLLHDRGTRFGIQSDGRTESVLMSLPPLVRWEYGYEPEPGSPEAELTERYLVPQDWV